MSRIDKSKLNPNFVKKSKSGGGQNNNNYDMFTTEFVGDSCGGDASSSVPQAVLKRAATTGILTLANKGLTVVPNAIWNLDEAIIRDESTKWWEYTDITTIDLSCNQISYLPPEISNIMALKKLDIHDNCLTGLPKELKQLKDLNKLDISRNSISKLQPNTFGALPSLIQLNANNNKLLCTGLESEVPLHLGQLDLSFNEITKVPASFGMMNKLQHLNLSHNKIQSIAPELSLCVSLQDLDLSHNQLVTVPTELGNLPQLTRLNLNNNKLKHFPSFQNCKKLKELMLNSNSIESIAEDSLNPLCECLEILLIADNQLKTLPQNFDVLTQLSSLDVSCNNLSTLPDRLGLLKSLKNLKVDGNPMRAIRQDVLKAGPGAVLKYLRNRIPIEEVETSKATIEENFITDSKMLNYSKQGANEIPAKLLIDAEVKRVQSINLEANKFSELGVEFSMLKHSVIDINLSTNHFTALPEVIPHFYNLQILKIANNRLSTLPDTLINLSKLMELNLNGNKFTQIPNIVYSLTSLQSLSIADNQLVTVDASSIRAMSNLSSLDVQNNCIQKVPPELGLCEQLKTLSLIGNPFRKPTFAEMNKGTVFILQKLRNQIVD